MGCCQSSAADPVEKIREKRREAQIELEIKEFCAKSKTEKGKSANRPPTPIPSPPAPDYDSLDSCSSYEESIGIITPEVLSPEPEIAVSNVRRTISTTTFTVAVHKDNRSGDVKSENAAEPGDLPVCDDDLQIIDIENEEAVFEQPVVPSSGYRINTRDVSMRPTAAKGHRKPPVFVEKKKTTSDVIIPHCVREFENEVDKLIGGQMRRGRQEKRVLVRPKAAKGVRTPSYYPPSGDARVKGVPGAVVPTHNVRPPSRAAVKALRPQLTVPGLVTPQDDCLRVWMVRQRQKSPDAYG